MAAFFVLFVMINWGWLCWAFVVGYLGKDRESEWERLWRGPCFSPHYRVDHRALLSARGPARAWHASEARKLFAQGEKKIKRRDYDAALQIVERVVASQPFGPAGEDVFTILGRLGKLKADGLTTEEELRRRKKGFSVHSPPVLWVFRMK